MTKSVRLVLEPRSVVCRRLFDPLDRVQLRRDLESVWTSVLERCRRRWGFDFHRLRPVDGGRYEWMPTRQTREDEADAAAAAPGKTSFAKISAGVELNRGVRERTCELRNKYLLPVDNNHADAVVSGSFLLRPKLVRDGQRPLNSNNSDHQNIVTAAAAAHASASKENELSLSTFQSNDLVVTSLRFPRFDSEQQDNYCFDASKIASSPDSAASSNCQLAAGDSFVSAVDSVTLQRSPPSSSSYTSPSLWASDASIVSSQRKRKRQPTSIAGEGKAVIVKILRVTV